MGFTPYWASQALAIAQGGAMVGRVGWGVASDRIFGGRRKIVLVIIGVLSSIVLIDGIESYGRGFILFHYCMAIFFLSGLSASSVTKAFPTRSSARLAGTGRDRRWRSA